MEIRKFILDLKPDGSVKWAEVCEPANASKDALLLKRLAMQQANSATSETNISYWQGFVDGIEALSKLD